MRQAGEVTFTQCHKDHAGQGYVCTCLVVLSATLSRIENGLNRSIDSSQSTRHDLCNVNVFISVLLILPAKKI